MAKSNAARRGSALEPDADRAALGPGPGPGGAPVIVLTYAHAGADLLTRVLSACPALACTSGTGLLPLCHSAAATWLRVEDRGDTPSALALQSVRSMASVMAAVVLGGAGASRWCETALAKPAAAATFLQVFPATTFLCLHRSLPAVLTESALTYPWGLGSSPFWPYSGSYPGNDVATVAAYWAAYTEPLLEFEAAHPRSCLRVRHEDLAADPDGQASQILVRLGLGPYGGPGLVRPPETGHPAASGEGAASPAPAARAAQIPPPLLAKVAELHERLAYAAFPAG